MSESHNVKAVGDPHSQTAASTAAPTPAVPTIRSTVSWVSPIKAPVATQAVVTQVPREPLLVKITASPTDYLGPAVAVSAALVTGLIGAYVVLWQVRRQRRDAQELHKANTKAQLRLEAYRDFQAALSKFYSGEFPDVRIALIRNQLENSIALTQRGLEISISARVMDFGEKLNVFMATLCDLTFFIERYESLLPGFDIFKTAIGSAMHDARRHRVAFDGVLLKWLPMDSVDPSGRPVLLNQRPTTTDALHEFDQAAEPMRKALGQAQVWVMDLAVDAQNFLLGDYADKPVSRRQPLDQTYFTVTTEPTDRDRLVAFFNATDYGRSNEASMLYAHARYATPQDKQAAGTHP